MKNEPMISIIICVLNREKDILKLIESISSLNYNNYEAFIIDNGSTDLTPSKIKEAIANSDKNIKLIDAADVYGSPYSARNKGISQSKGEFIAFTDGFPEPQWLSNLVLYAKTENLDIVAGKIKFPEIPEKLVYNLYDSIFSLDTEGIVRKFKAAPTGNLLVKKVIFDDIGLFKESIRSGGDILLTSQAVSIGYKIGYCSNANSTYYSRNKEQLIKKQKRIAKGQVGIWRFQKRTILIEVIKNILKLIIPLNPIETFNKISKQKKQFKKTTYIKLYLIRNYLDKIRVLYCLLNSLNLRTK